MFFQICQGGGIRNGPKAGAAEMENPPYMARFSAPFIHIWGK